MSRPNLKSFIGIADSNGVESFIDESIILPRDLNFMALRVRFNGHRHAVVYRAILDKSGASKVSSLMKKNQYREALLVIKQEAGYLAVAGTMAKTSWEKIPELSPDQIKQLARYFITQETTELEELDQLELPI